MKKSQCILWAGVSYGLGNTVGSLIFSTCKDRNFIIVSTAEIFV